MINKPKFSIITVVKNDALGLENTIKSVIKQNLSNYEHIIIGGESTDNTNYIIRKYQNNLSKSIIEKDNGIYFAMNKGLDFCTGEYVNFLNSGDTYASKDTLKQVSNNLNEYTEILSGSIYSINLSGDKIYKSWKDHFHPEQFMFCFHQAMFTKITIFDKYRFNTIYKVAADYEWALRCYLDKIKFDFIDLPLVNFREGGFSEINKIKSRIEELFIQSCYFECNNNILETNSLAKLKLYANRNNFILPKLLAKLDAQLLLFKKFEPNINLYGLGTVFSYIMNSKILDYRNVYDRNFIKFNKISKKCSAMNPNDISSDTKSYFLITALGYEKEIQSFLISKGIEKNKILQFEV